MATQSQSLKDKIKELEGNLSILGKEDKPIVEAAIKTAKAQLAKIESSKKTDKASVSDADAEASLEEFYKKEYVFPTMDAIKKAKAKGVEMLKKKHNLSIVKARTLVANWSRSRFVLEKTTQQASNKYKIGDNVSKGTTNGEVYEISADGNKFRLKDKFGNKSERWYVSKGFKVVKLENKTVAKTAKAEKSKKSAPKPSASSMPRRDKDGLYLIDDKSLDELDEFLKTLPTTQQLNSKNGDFTSDRKKLHEKIVGAELKDNTCIRREKPIAILTGGLPGSGKSTFIKNNADWMQRTEMFKIDADDIRAQLPEYKGWNANQTQDETRGLVKRLLKEVGRDGCKYDVLYDGTMNKMQKYIDLIKVMKSEGYRIFILFMQVSKDTSMERAMGRFQRSGRYVPKFVIEKGAKVGLDVFQEVKKMVDGYVLVDGLTQKIIEKGGAEIPADRDYTTLGDICSDCEPIPTYSWKKKTDVSKLNKIEFEKGSYALQVKDRMTVKMKGEGKSSILQDVFPGEWLIFDNGGYLVYVMMKTVGDRKFKIVKHAKPTKASKDAKPTPSSSKAKTPAPTKKKKKRATCTLADANLGSRIAKVEKFFIDHAMDWKTTNKSSKKIHKIVRLKDDGSIILEMSNWKGFRNSIDAQFGKREYYRLCIDSQNLTKIAGHPKTGTYNIVVPAAKMKLIYTTKGEEVHAMCVKTYRELLQCSFAGTCTTAQKAKWKTLYNECGDLISKLEKRPEAMSNFHKEVKKRRKSGEKYTTAMSRVASEIKKDFSS